MGCFVFGVRLFWAVLLCFGFVSRLFSVVFVFVVFKVYKLDCLFVEMKIYQRRKTLSASKKMNELKTRREGEGNNEQMIRVSHQ